jgi:alpha-glucoside transport system substrate-binding protein
VRSSRVSARPDVGPDCYDNDILSEASEILTTSIEEDTGRFDASDQMPPEVGSGSFWSEMMTYMQQGPDSVTSVLDTIEDSWPQ